MAAFIEFVLLTAVRRRDAGFLKVRDADLAKRVMTFRRTKSHSDHALPISGPVLHILKPHLIGVNVFGDIDPKKIFWIPAEGRKPKT